MDELVEFLRARLDEREQTVRAAGECRIAWLTYRDEQGQMLYTTVAADHSDGVWCAAGKELPAPASALVVYETEREFAEVEVKRRIIEQHSPHGGCRPPDAWYGDQNQCQTCGGYTVAAGFGDRGYRSSWPCPTLRLIALPYARHPAFKEEWRP